jgi:hypothetical protein
VALETSTGAHDGGGVGDGVVGASVVGDPVGAAVVGAQLGVGVGVGVVGVTVGEPGQNKMITAHYPLYIIKATSSGGNKGNRRDGGRA